jgi:hypothetical protein
MKFLGAEASYENEILSFLTYDEEHHRVAIVKVPDTGPKNPSTGWPRARCVYFRYT